MATDTSHVRRAAIWRLARAQHGVVSADQLARLRLSPAAIRHRARRGSLHRIHPGVYAVGRPELGPRGHWMAAVLASGSGAALSDLSAARLWEIVRRAPGRIHVTLPRGVDRRPAGITIHRRRQVKGDVVERDGIPVTSPIRTLIDLATRLDRRGLERAVNEADRIDLVSPEDLRSAIAGRRERGVGVLRGLLDRRTFRLTDSELERRFLGLVRRAQLPLPDTGSV
ncbi:MAG: type IV toxin-antitoxin system AbiEi family antitoxin domain-containing protein, partial [Solirubrobacterales bacterium]